MGTGLNLLLTALKAGELNLNIQYTALEPYPLDINQSEELNYSKCLEVEPKLLETIHKSDWNKLVCLNSNLNFTKHQKKIQDIHFNQNFHLIYFDAFAPDLDPSTWHQEVFFHLSRQVFPNAILVTYSCKGSVKRTLKPLGFRLQKLPGPGKKREILRATWLGNKAQSP